MGLKVFFWRILPLTGQRVVCFQVPSLWREPRLSSWWRSHAPWGSTWVTLDRRVGFYGQPFALHPPGWRVAAAEPVQLGTLRVHGDRAR